MSTNIPSLWKILSETWHTIKAHPRHFSALSVLFLLPVSILATVYSFVLQPTSLNSQFIQSLFLNSTPNPKTPPVENNQFLLITFLYILSTILFSYSAIPSITYSTFTAFHGKPVNFISSLKPILVSFFPLLATLLVREVIYGLIIVAFCVLMLVVYNGLALLGLEMDYDSGYFLAFVIVIAVILGVVLVYLSVEWCLSTVVVVLESKWGFAPMKRSSYLVKGMRKVVFSMVLLFGVIGGVLSIWYSNLVANAGGIDKGWMIVQLVVYVGFSTMLSLYGLAATTVLFVYCKALHEEIGEGYVRLGMEDGVAPYFVNVV